MKSSIKHKEVVEKQYARYIHYGDKITVRIGIEEYYRDIYVYRIPQNYFLGIRHPNSLPKLTIEGERLDYLY